MVFTKKAASDCVSCSTDQGVRSAQTRQVLIVALQRNRRTCSAPRIPVRLSKYFGARPLTIPLMSCSGWYSCVGGEGPAAREETTSTSAIRYR